MKNKLYFYYGGFRGPFYEILYKNKLFEISLGEVGSNETYYISCPPKEKWDQFWVFLENKKIWEWNKEYIDQNILDGTQWEIDFSNSVKRVKSYGSNKFPNKNEFKNLIIQIENLFNFELKNIKSELT